MHSQECMQFRSPWNLQEFSGIPGIHKIYQESLETWTFLMNPLNQLRSQESSESRCIQRNPHVSRECIEFPWFLGNPGKPHDFTGMHVILSLLRNPWIHHAFSGMHGIPMNSKESLESQWPGITMKSLGLLIAKTHNFIGFVVKCSHKGLLKRTKIIKVLCRPVARCPCQSHTAA